MKLGIIGAGHVAQSVAKTLAVMPEIEVYAVASRNLEKAEEFARNLPECSFEKRYGSYEELYQDPQVELVYIATPHSHHFEQMFAAIRYGKHVICEKAFTMNAVQACEVSALAKEKGVYVAEALWTRYMPSRKLIDDVLTSGIIGKPNVLTANLSYIIHHKERIQRPELAGGALLDIGVYGVNFALMHFGDAISRIESAVQLTDTGVDGMETITFFYEDGRMAVLTHSIYSRSDRKGIIHGDKGYMVIENINNPQSVDVYDLYDCHVAHYDVPAQISGYEYEFAEAVRSITEGKTESASMPLADSIRLMEVMDSLRYKWGVIYPQERKTV